MQHKYTLMSIIPTKYAINSFCLVIFFPTKYYIFYNHIHKQEKKQWPSHSRHSSLSTLQQAVHNSRLHGPNISQHHCFGTHFWELPWQYKLSHQWHNFSIYIWKCTHMVTQFTAALQNGRKVFLKKKKVVIWSKQGFADCYVQIFMSIISHDYTQKLAEDGQAMNSAINSAPQDYLERACYWLLGYCFPQDLIV